MMLMVISDILVATSLSYLSIILFCFVVAAHKNRGKHGYGTTEEDHYIEHVMAGFSGLIGCIIGSIAAIIHLVLQNTAPYIVPPEVEILANIADTILFVSAAGFVIHMIKEENPKHPFYYMHYQKRNDDKNN